MLEDVGTDHYVERLRPLAGGQCVASPPIVVALTGRRGDPWICFDPREIRATVSDFPPELTSCGAEVEQPQTRRKFPDSPAEQIVRGARDLLPDVFFGGVHGRKAISSQLSALSWRPETRRYRQAEPEAGDSGLKADS